jgi:hypothetical protein
MIFQNFKEEEHYNGTRDPDLRGYDFLIGMKAYYRLQKGDRVKDLPYDARCAFTPIPGGRPYVDFAGGFFWSLKWTEWDATRTKMSVGDYLYEDEDYGIWIVPMGVVVLEAMIFSQDQPAVRPAQESTSSIKAMGP